MNPNSFYNLANPNFHPPPPPPSLAEQQPHQAINTPFLHPSFSNLNLAQPFIPSQQHQNTFSAIFDENDKPERRIGRRKIKIEYIQDKSKRHITFSKRKAGIMKKAYELSALTGTQVLLLVVSETGLVYTFTTSKLQSLVTSSEGKQLIQECLNAPDKPYSSRNNSNTPDVTVPSSQNPSNNETYSTLSESKNAYSPFGHSSIPSQPPTVHNGNVLSNSNTQNQQMPNQRNYWPSDRQGAQQ